MMYNRIEIRNPSRFRLLFVLLTVIIFDVPKTLLSTLSPVAALAAERKSNKVSRTLHFPQGRAIGVIYTRPASSGDFSYGNPQNFDEWQRIGPAKGKINIAADRQVRLDLNKRASTDLQWSMQRLGPSDIDMLYARGTDIDDAHLRHLGHLTGLRHLDLRHNPLTNAGIHHLKKLTKLKYLHLGAFDVHRDGFGVGDEAMEIICKLPALESIHLRLTKVTDRGLEHLAGCKTLRSIGVEGTGVSDAGLKHLLKLPHLKTLSLGVYDEGAKVTDEGMKTVGQLKGLKSLRLSGTSITNAGLAHLTSLKNLEDLDIDETEATEEGLVHLTELQRLRRLRLFDTVTDLGAEHLSKLPEIERISCNMDVSDKGVAYLSKLPKLQQLMLSDERVTDVSVEYISKMPSLRILWFQNCNITDQGIAQLPSSKTIEHLVIHVTDVTTSGLAYLQNMPNLKSLNFSLEQINDTQHDWRVLEGFTQIEDLQLRIKSFQNKDLIHLSTLRQLKGLDLIINTPINDDGINHLRGLQSLQRLDIAESIVTDRGLQALADMKDLEYMTISCLATNSGLKHLRNMNSMRYLQIASPYLTETGLDSLAKRMPSLQTLNHFTYRLRGSVISAVDKDEFFRKGRLEDRKEKNALEDQPPPELIVRNWINTNGQELKLEAFRGDVLLIAFWESWSSRSSSKVPALKKIYEKYTGQDFEILGIHSTFRSNNVTEFARQNKMTWPIAIDCNEQTKASWHVDSYPEYYLIDRKGNLRIAGIFDDHLDEAIKTLLAE